MIFVVLINGSFIMSKELIRSFDASRRRVFQTVDFDIDSYSLIEQPHFVASNANKHKHWRALFLGSMVHQRVH